MLVHPSYDWVTVVVMNFNTEYNTVIFLLIIYIDMFILI